ncbi:Tol-Pal system beta propeller repeat protein TolB [Gammaproteobacteria bacterium]|mgnify:CR=1 FL=1|nr:Tol-Pal system beta propeller repeat protein TolB [Gammaproteobacteria bacterium]MDA9049035.1 Tol-Pal system beta propeller repeat protein TolB [Gammaproteobacteria bacterium]MDA9340868.1 Tol-Pal system beta propeller repeat protein TolB [Gammaproteobacteria bacterium]MDB9790727.1 Tol-Pal system beta propeller repeat protein TolB [Gammaproteobacteria bacterium]MDC0091501.1 Tol-Pal system beta propeller repeat protein TolB [Gammaproteobacteria bacterium]
MKKNLLLTLLALPMICMGELFLEITKGSDNPFKVAIIPFAGSPKVSKPLHQIIQNDLDRTGEFSLLDSKLLLPLIKTDEEINYQDWSLLGIDYLVAGNIIQSKSSVDINYDIYDIQKRKKIRNSKVFGLPGQTRQLAHYTSDGIYESISGIKGIASTKLLYVNEVKSNTPEASYRLMLADSDGANENTLLTSSEPIISPSWSPDGKKVAYVSFETGLAKVYIQDIATGQRESVLSKNTQISSPAWSPDGKYLSLTLYQDGNAEIYILRLHDKTLTRMTNQFAIDTESSWSPKGNKILFTSGRSGSPQIYELNLRRLNSKARRISFEGSYNAKAAYLPNEEGIIFVHRSGDGLFHIAMKYKKENFIRILTEAKMDESPSVAPNGNMVIYGITEGDQSMLAGFSLSGASFKLPASEGEVREPAWSNFLR